MAILDKSDTKKKDAPPRAAKDSRDAVPTRAPSLAAIARVVTIAAIVVGGTVTLLSLMALLGVVTQNVVLHAILALVVTAGVPIFITDRIVSRFKRVAPASAALAALILMITSHVFVGPLFGPMRRAYFAEGDRLATGGFDVPARVLYFIGGAAIKDAPPVSSGSPPPVGSSAASATRVP